MTRYRWVAARKAEGFPNSAACRVAEVSRQAFYDWRDRQQAGPLAVERAEAELVAEMRQIHADSGGAYGSARVTAELRRRGRCVNHKRVCRLMRHHGICGIYKRRRPRWRRDSAAQQAPPDLVRRRFGPGRPDSVWAGDITYIPTGEGWLYLAAVLDIGSRRLIGYSMAADMPARLVIDALDTAAASRGHRTAGVIFHSDRGSQAGFNRSSQHLDDGGVWWGRCASGSARFSCIGGRCRRRAGRRWRGVRTGCGFGRR